MKTIHTGLQYNTSLWLCYTGLVFNKKQDKRKHKCKVSPTPRVTQSIFIDWKCAMFLKQDHFFLKMCMELLNIAILFSNGKVL